MDTCKRMGDFDGGRSVRPITRVGVFSLTSWLSCLLPAFTVAAIRRLLAMIELRGPHMIAWVRTFVLILPPSLDARRARSGVALVGVRGRIAKVGAIRPAQRK